MIGSPFLDIRTAGSFQLEREAIPVYQGLMEHRPLILNAYNSLKRSDLDRLLKKEIQPLFDQLVENQSKSLFVEEEGRDFLSIGWEKDA